MNAMPPKTIRREVTHFGVNFLTGPLVRLPIQLPSLHSGTDGLAALAGPHERMTLEAKAVLTLAVLRQRYEASPILC
jgi:hypothetical protein